MSFPCLSLPDDPPVLAIGAGKTVSREARMGVIGLMSGTSLDGVDAAFIKTDGLTFIQPGPALTLAYPQEFREQLRTVLGLDPVRDRGKTADIEARLTRFHAEAVKTLCWNMAQASEKTTPKPCKPELIGFPGHTLTHAPQQGWTWQLGDGNALAQATRINVIEDFRSADIAAGGQGAPLAPLFHHALWGQKDQAVAFLNIGGVANVTWIGPQNTLMAFDTGPGNGLIDDWVKQHGKGDYDGQGHLAAEGHIHQNILATWLNAGYFRRKPPKSLDRLSFDESLVSGLSLIDGAATLTEFTARTIAKAAEHFPFSPERWFVTGGGRHNPYLMKRLQSLLQQSVTPIEEIGWSGDFLEAQAFAYLAVRALKGLPITYPATTGVETPLSGGRFCPVMD